MGNLFSGGNVQLSIVALLLCVGGIYGGGVTSQYRRKLYAGVDMPLEAFPPPLGYNAPEQVHITQGDMDGRGVIISWVNPIEKHPNFVTVWPADGKKEVHCRTSHATTTSYRYYNYSSGYIHHALVNNLEFNTKYNYEIGIEKSARRFSFVTPPEPGPDVPYTFGIIGDLGQTKDSNQTLHNYMSHKEAQALLFAGDLSYADDHPHHDNRKWDSWGRFVEKSNAYQPWIWTSGNHELDLDLEIGESEPFKPYLHRYRTPYEASGSSCGLWYSIKRGPAYIILLSSYSAFSKYTLQYNWLSNEFPKVNRSETPWLIVILHSPWYNSNNYHYMEGEDMRVVFEPWFVENKVDLVISGHVHSYERSHRVSNVKYNITNGERSPVRDPSAPVYITIGDGGNIEGIANNFSDPQPSYSAFREASFGHAILEIKNRSHAHYAWHRNHEGVGVVADAMMFYNRYFFPMEEM